MEFDCSLVPSANIDLLFERCNYMYQYNEISAFYPLPTGVEYCFICFNSPLRSFHILFFVLQLAVRPERRKSIQPRIVKRFHYFIRDIVGVNDKKRIRRHETLTDVEHQESLISDASLDIERHSSVSRCEPAQLFGLSLLSLQNVIACTTWNI